MPPNPKINNKKKSSKLMYLPKKPATCFKPLEEMIAMTNKNSQSNRKNKLRNKDKTKT